MKKLLVSLLLSLVVCSNVSASEIYFDDVYPLEDFEQQYVNADSPEIIPDEYKLYLILKNIDNSDREKCESESLHQNMALKYGMNLYKNILDSEKLNVVLLDDLYALVETGDDIKYIFLYMKDETGRIDYIDYYDGTYNIM